MVKKHFLSLLCGMLLLGGVGFVNAGPVDLHWGLIDPIPGTPGMQKTPVLVPSVSLDDNVITFLSSHGDLMLRLLDANNNEVYSTFVYPDTSMVELPTTLSGSYVLRLETDSYYYIGYINL